MKPLHRSTTNHCTSTSFSIHPMSWVRVDVEGGDEAGGVSELTAVVVSSFTLSCVVRRGDVDLNGKNFGGWTPLMYASYIGHDNIVNLLLEAGVNVNATTAKGLTPLMLAASCGNESIAYFLLQVLSTVVSVCPNGCFCFSRSIDRLNTSEGRNVPFSGPKSKELSWS